MNRRVATSHGTITIREANPADEMAFRGLRLEALQESPAAFPADYQVSAGQPPDYWQGRLKAEEDEAFFFAEHEDRLIGMTGIRRRASAKTRHNADIWGVYVRPEWRGLHIAEALIEACAAWAKVKDITILKLGVVIPNEAAVRCYQRCGFTVYGTEPRGLSYGGQYYDGYMMYRDLDPAHEENFHDVPR